MIVSRNDPLNKITRPRQIKMQDNRVNEFLNEALDADDSSEKDYYVRQAIQLLRATDHGATSVPTVSENCLSQQDN